MSVWSRIKDHKVLQWTLAYAVAANTLPHGVELVGNAFTWPQAVVRLVTLASLVTGPVLRADGRIRYTVQHPLMSMVGKLP